MIIYVASTSAWFNRPVKLDSPFANTAVDHYALSEYLPPINTGPRGQAKPRKGAPKLAKQEILSVPPNPDNTHQTIVTPPNVKLNHDVPLPNIVAWTNICQGSRLRRRNASCRSSSYRSSRPKSWNRPLTSPS